MPRVARLRGARDNHHRNRQDDHAGDAQHHEQLAAELQPRGVFHLGQRQTAHDSTARRGEQVHQAVAGAEDHDHDVGREAQRVRQRAHDGHGHRGHAGRRRDQERPVSYTHL